MISQPSPAITLVLDGMLAIVTGHDDGTRRLHETVTQAPLSDLLAGRPLVFSGGADGTVRVWGLAARRWLDVIEMLGKVSAIEATTDGYLLVAAAGEVIAFRHVDAVLR